MASWILFILKTWNEDDMKTFIENTFSINVCYMYDGWLHFILNVFILASFCAFISESISYEIRKIYDGLIFYNIFSFFSRAIFKF
jgi:hypothetical protein